MANHDDILYEIINFTETYLSGNPITQSTIPAAAAAHHIAESLRQNWCGQTVYIKAKKGDKRGKPNAGDRLLQDATEAAFEVFENFGLDPMVVAEVANDLTENIRSYLSGQTIYIKKHSAERYRRIRAGFNGWNHRQLCEKYNISYNRLMQILKHTIGE